MAYIYAMHPDNRIRELRKRAGLSQAELGALIGMHQTMVGNLENGRRSLTLEWARRFAKELDVSVPDLLSDQDNPARLRDDERELLELYRAAAPEQRENIRRVSEALSGSAPAAERAA